MIPDHFTLFLRTQIYPLMIFVPLCLLSMLPEAGLLGLAHVHRAFQYYVEVEITRAISALRWILGKSGLNLEACWLNTTTVRIRPLCPSGYDAQL
ncbi:hypothetical protein BX666DRAFT_387354 [Dichotomocladium elegans]|nr:hypothetical protein BX666DRAFT_387354 [Dichotomocladium elegans]